MFDEEEEELIERAEDRFARVTGNLGELQQRRREEETEERREEAAVARPEVADMRPEDNGGSVLQMEPFEAASGTWGEWTDRQSTPESAGERAPEQRADAVAPPTPAAPTNQEDDEVDFRAMDARFEDEGRAAETGVLAQREAIGNVRPPQRVSWNEETFPEVTESFDVDVPDGQTQPAGDARGSMLSDLAGRRAQPPEGRGTNGYSLPGEPDYTGADWSDALRRPLHALGAGMLAGAGMRAVPFRSERREQEARYRQATQDYDQRHRMLRDLSHRDRQQGALEEERASRREDRAKQREMQGEQMATRAELSRAQLAQRGRESEARTDIARRRQQVTEDERDYRSDVSAQGRDALRTHWAGLAPNDRRRALAEAGLDEETSFDHINAIDARRLLSTTSIRQSRGRGGRGGGGGGGVVARDRWGTEDDWVYRAQLERFRRDPNFQGDAEREARDRARDPAFRDRARPGAYTREGSEVEQHAGRAAVAERHVDRQISRLVGSQDQQRGTMVVVNRLRRNLDRVDQTTLQAILRAGNANAALAEIPSGPQASAARGVVQDIYDLVDRLARERTGAVVNDSEQETFDRISGRSAWRRDQLLHYLGSVEEAWNTAVADNRSSLSDEAAAEYDRRQSRESAASGSARRIGPGSVVINHRGERVTIPQGAPPEQISGIQRAIDSGRWSRGD